MLYIGLMSGTSMDAVDAVLMSADNTRLHVLAHHSNPIPVHLRQSIHLLSHPGEDSVVLLGKTDRAIGELFAQTTLELLANQNLASADIKAIGSHGQTIRHCPPSLGTEYPYTVQIGDPNLIAAITGITTVADFRRKDVALGGEGAPLVPAFHQAVFRSDTRSRAIVNIGGIANITWLPPRSSDDRVIGFDTGPGNCLMDAWIRRHRGEPFDQWGSWAASGNLIPALLSALLNEPYLSKAPPKSTGKELFNLEWLDSLTAEYTVPPQDIQATLCCFTVETIAMGIAACSANGADEIFICGGGALNQHLMSLLEQKMPGTPIQSTAACGIDPMHVEAAAFAWLAHQTLNHLPGNLPEVTGASRPAVLGGIYLP